MKLKLPSMRTSRREFLRFVAYGLPAWLGLCHLREPNDPPPVRLAADSEAKVVGGVNFEGGLKGDLSGKVSFGGFAASLDLKKPPDRSTDSATAV